MSKNAAEPETAATHSESEDDLSALMELLDGALDRSNYVEEWPEDEQDLFRNGWSRGEWGNYIERSAKLDELRRRNTAIRILAAGFRRTQPGA